MRAHVRRQRGSTLGAQALSKDFCLLRVAERIELQSMDACETLLIQPSRPRSTKQKMALRCKDLVDKAGGANI